MLYIFSKAERTANQALVENAYRVAEKLTQQHPEFAAIAVAIMVEAAKLEKLTELAQSYNLIV
jgi:hypothetical protein